MKKVLLVLAIIAGIICVAYIPFEGSAPEVTEPTKAEVLEYIEAVKSLDEPLGEEGEVAYFWNGEAVTWGDIYMGDAPEDGEADRLQREHCASLPDGYWDANTGCP